VKTKANEAEIICRSKRHSYVKYSDMDVKGSAKDD
jgi:hypothetical protein